LFRQKKERWGEFIIEIGMEVLLSIKINLLEFQKTRGIKIIKRKQMFLERASEQQGIIFNL
jgi:hypothetical protein